MEPSEKDTRAENAFLRAEIKRLRKSLGELTPPLEAMLKRRGFRIFKKEPPDDLLVPAGEFVDEYYAMLRKYSFRLFLRDIIKHQPLFTPEQVARYATREVTGEYIRRLADMDLIARRDDAYMFNKSPVRNFGATLEWFIAEIFRREFASDAIWGIKMKRPLVGGDYDLLAKIDGSILYMEIKSSPPKQIYRNEITAFFSRAYDLVPGIAVFFVDTELRMKDKMVPMFEDELRSRFQNPPGVKRMERELFEVAAVEHALPMMFIINAKDSIAANIERVLARYFRNRVP